MTREVGSRLRARMVVALGLAALAAAAPMSAKAACPPQQGTDAALLAAPDLRAAIAAADSMVNARGKRWTIEKAGVPPSLLVGTFHLPLGGAEVPPPAIEAAVRTARLVMVEITPEDMRAEMNRAMTADPGLVLQFDKPPLSALLSPQQARMADRALSGLGLSLAVVDRFRPWAVFLLTAMPACIIGELAQTGSKGLDERILALAREAGVEVRSLETFLELVDILEPDTPEAVRDLLVATVGIAGDAEARMHDTRALYSAGEIGAIWMLAGSDLRQSKLLEDPDAAMRRFWETLIAGRNASMAERAAPELERGGVVMAVGALHLPGDDGLVELLRGRGFEVSRAD